MKLIDNKQMTGLMIPTDFSNPLNNRNIMWNSIDKFKSMLKKTTNKTDEMKFIIKSLLILS